MHPVANYVVASAVGRLGAEELGSVIRELGGKGEGGGGGTARRMIKLGRTGVLRSLIERAALIENCEKEVEEVRLTAVYISIS